MASLGQRKVLTLVTSAVEFAGSVDVKLKLIALASTPCSMNGSSRAWLEMLLVAPVATLSPWPIGNDAVDVVVVVQGQAQLLQVVDALAPAGGLAGGLHGGQQQGDQHGDDGDDDQQLDQRERGAAMAA